MFTQSCSFLQNNKQSPLSGPIHHNLGILATRNYSNLTKAFVDIKHRPTQRPEYMGSLPTKLNLSNFEIHGSYQTRPMSQSNVNRTTEGPNLDTRNMKQRSNSKEVLEVSPVPFTSSYLVGGFVGSKSQLGRHLTQGFNLKMWDIIRGLGFVDLNQNNSVNIGKISICQHNSSMGSEHHSSIRNIEIPNIRPNYYTSERGIHRPHFEKEQDETQDLGSKKKSYADVAKINLPLVPSKNSKINVSDHQNVNSLSSNKTNTLIISKPKLTCEPNLNTKVVPNVTLASSEENTGMHHSVDTNSPIQSMSSKQTNGTHSDINCERSNKPLLKSILKNTSKNIGPLEDTPKPSEVKSRLAPDNSSENSSVTNRDRIVSQCSDDSESSFIVFETSEDDPSSSGNTDADEESDDDDSSETCSCESDEDSLSDYEDQSSEQLTQDQPLNSKSHSSHPKYQELFQPRKKRVRFAEEADLVTVWEVDKEVTEGRSEWELHALDCWRFRQRIRETEATLQSVLEPAHRQRIYLQRFAD